MGINLTVRDQSSTGKSTGTVELEDVPTSITLRDLIRTRVRLILSKAFMLAEDTKIEDRTIRAQIESS
jgi:hypothetical protein